MKRFLLPVALFFCFYGCTSDIEMNNNPDVNVPSCGNNVDEILRCAVDELKKDNLDEALAYYNTAYEKDNNNPKAIIYSSLANLAKISTDPKMVALMREHFGFTNYPNKLNALLDDKWMKEYKDPYEYCHHSYVNEHWVEECVKEYDVVKLPAIKTPDWVKGSGSMYNKALLSGNVMSAENWTISLLANVVDKNSNGFNPLLDDVIEGVFGTSFNLAVERLKKLENRKEDRVRLDSYFIDEFELEDVFDEYDQIGWAEVNAVVSAMLLVKASLEYVQSYDLSTDLNWLKYPWKEDADDALNHFKKVDAKNLPFNNNFFKVRPGKMENSKASYVKAIRGFQSSYSSILKSDLYPEKVKESYATINGGFEELIKAIENGTKFYIPEDPTKGTWPTSKRKDVELTIDLGKFFTPGYFSLQNIFETNGGKPVFYSRHEVSECEEDDEGWWYWCDYSYSYTKLDKSNYAEAMSNGGRLALGIKMAPFSAIIDERNDNIEHFNIDLKGEAAKTVFEKYYP